MEINLFGAKRFGQELIAFEAANDPSKYNQYNYIIIQNTRPDGKGNGSFDMKILNGDQGHVSWAKGWKVNEIYGLWSWTNKIVYVNIIDPFEIRRELRFVYSNRDSLEEVAHSLLKDLINICENFENSFELLLAKGRDENYNEISFEYVKGEGSVEEFEKNRQKVLEFWSIYSQYINNPIYRRNVSLEHIKLIEDNLYKMTSRLINFIFKEEK